MLRHQLRDAHRISNAVADTLVQIGPTAAAALPELVAIVENDVHSGDRAVPVLAMILRETPGMAARLRAPLADDAPRVRQLGERAIALAQTP